MAEIPAGWYDDGTGNTRWWDGQAWGDAAKPAEPVAPSTPSGTDAGGAVAQASVKASANTGPAYVVVQTILKEKLWGTGSGNLPELEKAINTQAAKGYRLHTISTASSGSKGFGGGDRIQATMVFERIG